MKKIFPFSILLVALILTACSPSEAQVQTAVAETEAAAPTETAAPVPTDIPTEMPTVMPTEAPTETLAPSPSPTPDLRVINTDPKSIILTLDEMTDFDEVEQNISYPKGYLNKTCALGADEAVAFLERTGLVTGWTTVYHLPDIGVEYSGYFEITPLVFESLEGPNLMFEEWGGPCEYDVYDYVEDLDYGEKTTACIYRIWQESSQNDLIKYRLAIKYKNVLLGVLAQGLEDSFDLDQVYRLVDLQMDKLASLPLEEEITLVRDIDLGDVCYIPPTPEPGRNKSDDDSGTRQGWCMGGTVNGEHVCVSACLHYCPDPVCLPCTLDEDYVIIKDPQK